MNRRNKEFAEEVSNLLRLIRDKAYLEAQKKNVSPYEIELEIDWCLKVHMTNRMIATETCARRHFDNLNNRELFIFCGDRDNEKLKLNPIYADKEVDLIISHVKMPKNEAIKND